MANQQRLQELKASVYETAALVLRDAFEQGLFHESYMEEATYTKHTENSISRLAEGIVDAADRRAASMRQKSVNTRKKKNV